MIATHKFRRFAGFGKMRKIDRGDRVQIMKPGPLNGKQGEVLLVDREYEPDLAAVALDDPLPQKTLSIVQATNLRIE